MKLRDADVFWCSRLPNVDGTPEHSAPSTYASVPSKVLRFHTAIMEYILEIMET